MNAAEPGGVGGGYRGALITPYTRAVTAGEAFDYRAPRVRPATIDTVARQSVP